VIGGTIAVIGGGKFANGAMTGAFQYIVNQVQDLYEEMAKTKYNEGDFNGGRWGRLAMLNCVTAKDCSTVTPLDFADKTSNALVAMFPLLWPLVAASLFIGVSNAVDQYTRPVDIYDKNSPPQQDVTNFAAMAVGAATERNLLSSGVTAAYAGRASVFANVAVSATAYAFERNGNPICVPQPPRVSCP
jgi:hypothetical protein